MKLKELSCSLATVITLAGCANSANHEVVSANQATDQGLTCNQIDAEMIRVQAIMDGVAQDKDDVSGADIIDGVLWFPFNLVAKHSNYESALEAADARMLSMKELKDDKSCDEAVPSQQIADTTTQKLIALNELYKQGVLTKEEYQTRKALLLDQLTDTAPTTVAESD